MKFTPSDGAPEPYIKFLTLGNKADARILEVGVTLPTLVSPF